MLGKLEPLLKTGHEQLKFDNRPIKFSVLDFWRWSASDLMSNATRGLLAEFIVASAIGIDKVTVRDEWSAYDLQTATGIKIEVKSCAYLQTWQQRKLSSITFGIAETRELMTDTNTYATKLKRQADVYVFCLLHHQDKQTVDPLNLDQWEFFVVATVKLNELMRGAKSISLKTLRLLTQAVKYDQLKDEIVKKRE